MRCTFYKNTFGEKSGDFDLQKVVENIKAGLWHQKCWDVRKLYGISQEAYDNAKKSLFCFTPACVSKQSFSASGKNKGKICPPMLTDILEYNNLVIVDFDKISEFDLDNAIAAVRECEYSHVVFKSPSGFGIKIFVKHDGLKGDHKRAFKMINNFYSELVGGLKYDPSGSNINRLCYVSSDPNAIYNKDSKVFQLNKDLFTPILELTEDIEDVQQQEDSGSQDKQLIPKTEPTAALFAKLSAKMERDGLVYENSRHGYVRAFAIDAVKYGISEQDCLSFCIDNFQDKDSKEWESLVKWAYITIKEVGIYEKSKGVAKTDKKVEEKEYKAELFKEYSDLIEDHTEVVEEITHEFVDALTKDKEVKQKIWAIYLLEKFLKENFDFRYNIMNQVFEYRSKTAKKYAVLDEAAYNSLTRHCLFRGTLTSSIAIKKSVESEFSKKQHPLRELFLSWHDKHKDETTDYIDEVASLVKTDAPKGLWKSLFKKWVVASVANVFVDNYCTNRYCPILIGGQDEGKTKFYKSLWPHEYPEYFYSGEIDLKNGVNKDSILRLVDTFIIVIDEQLSMIDSPKEWESLKGLITKDRIKTRRVWGHHDTMAARMANFCGGVNHPELLMDPSGNSRFWTFRLTEHIDLNKFKDLDMTKFWAQAYTLHKAAQNNQYHYLPTNDEKKLMREYQDHFKKYDVEHELILDCYEVGYANDFTHFFTTTELWKAFSKEHPRLNITPHKIGSALKFLGYTRERKKRGDGGRVEGWYLKAINKIGQTQTNN